jgi:hypothetical protein
LLFWLVLKLREKKIVAPEVNAVFTYGSFAAIAGLAMVKFLAKKLAFCTPALRQDPTRWAGRVASVLIQGYSCLKMGAIKMDKQ